MLISDRERKRGRHHVDKLSPGRREKVIADQADPVVVKMAESIIGIVVAAKWFGTGKHRFYFYRHWPANSRQYKREIVTMAALRIDEGFIRLGNLAKFIA